MEIGEISTKTGNCPFCNSDNPQLVTVSIALDGTPIDDVTHHFCKRPPLSADTAFADWLADRKKKRKRPFQSGDDILGQFKTWLSKQPRYAHLVRKEVA